MGWKSVITHMESGLLLSATRKKRTARIPFTGKALIAFSLLLFSFALVTGCGGTAGAVEKRIVMGEYFFEPIELQGKMDRELRITLVNEGSQAHTFTIDDLPVSGFRITDPGSGPEAAAAGARLVDPADEDGNGAGGAHGDGTGGEILDSDGDNEEPAREGLSVTVLPSSTVVVEFIPREAGTFTFFCEQPGHRDAGMEGTLLVTLR